MAENPSKSPESNDDYPGALIALLRRLTLLEWFIVFVVLGMLHIFLLWGAAKFSTNTASPQVRS
jgi:hypothetical protein